MTILEVQRRVGRPFFVIANSNVISIYLYKYIILCKKYKYILQHYILSIFTEETNVCFHIILAVHVSYKLANMSLIPLCIRYRYNVNVSEIKEQSIQIVLFVYFALLLIDTQNKFGMCGSRTTAARAL